MKFVLMHKTI